jgi:hypothetical protein
MGYDPRHNKDDDFVGDDDFRKTRKRRMNK